MSGVFGPVAQIQVPDFAATQMRAQELAMRRQAMQERDALSGFFRNNAQGFASPDAAKRMNLLAMLAAQGGQGAAMALPQMQALREEMEWTGAGHAAPQAAPQGAPMAMPAVAAPGGGDYLSRLIRDESGGDPSARNPRSSATGAAQFIDSTWLRFAEANPQRFAGMSREQILAARTDPNLSREAAEWYRRTNMETLAGQGLPANDGTAALAHRFGAGDAARLLRADQNAPIASVVSDAVMRANPDLAGRSVGDVVGRYQQRFGGNAIPAQTAAPGAAPRDAGGLPPVPGFDMERVRRAISLPNNAAAQRYLQTYMQAAQVMQREAEPLEIVEGPNGPMMVPRSQAVGQRPSSRETAPRSPERLAQDLALAEAGAARSSTTVNPGESAFERERGKTLAERASDWEAAGTRAAQTLSRLSRFEALNQQFMTGRGAELSLTAGQLAQRLGVPDAVLGALGIARDQVAAGEGLRSLTSQMLVGLIGSGGFPAQNFSNADREMLERALPAIANSPRGNEVIATILRTAAERDRQVGAAWREWTRANGESAESVRRFQAERLPGIVDPDVLRPILEDAVPANMPDAPRGVQADPPPRAPAPPRVGEVRDGFRFRGGNPGDRNSWEAVR